MKNLPKFYAILTFTMLQLAPSISSAVEVEKISDDEISCQEIKQEIQDMTALINSNSSEATSAKARVDRLLALAKVSKCKLQ